MFRLNERHERIRGIARLFAEHDLQPLVPSLESGPNVRWDLLGRLAATGWFGIAIPREFDGLGEGHLAKTLVIEELSRISAAAGITMQSAQLGSAIILGYANESQKRRFLPKLASGEMVATICVTEPDSGSHVAGMQTTAVRDGKDWILNGRKCFIANSHLASLHGVVARTGRGGKGVTAFLVEADRPGVRPGIEHDTIGLRGFNLGEVVFEDCRIPASNVVGEIGQGLEVAHHAITRCGKPNLTAVALGIHQSILEDSIRFSSERSLYGKPLNALESARVRLADIYTDVHTGRLSAYHAVNLLDAGSPCDAELMMAKLVVCEGAARSARTAMDMMGARGCLRDYPAERRLRDILMTMPPAGTSDVHRKRIADIALGRYQVPWTDTRDHVAAAVA
ncbi:MAG: acyl-CoA dehydrogenase [Azospirillum sp.]|nr:acyl-CoA dehydrogenase [Azospirillum sp.]